MLRAPLDPRHDSSRPLLLPRSRRLGACVVLWGEATGELRRIERPEGSEEYRHALEASRLLLGLLGR